jgi:hypothetical protein
MLRDGTPVPDRTDAAYLGAGGPIVKPLCTTGGGGLLFRVALKNNMMFIDKQYAFRQCRA